MTVSSANNKTTYSGGSGVTSFSTGFTFAEDGELTVTLVTDATGAETTWTAGTQYNLTGSGTGANGTLTIDTSPTDYTPASGETLVIELEPDFTQTTSLPRGGTVSPKDTLEPMHDKRVRQLLRLKDQTDLSLKVSVAESTIGTLPNILNRKTKVMAFDSSGDPVMSTLTITAMESGAVDAAAHAAAALVSKNAAAADVVLSNADVVLTNADVVSSGNNATTAQAAAQGWGAVTTITAATTNLEVADARDYYILKAASNTLTINLPAIGSSDGILFGFEVSNIANAITIVRDGTDTINGAASSYTGLVAVGQVIHFIGDDTTPDNWLATIVSQTGAASATASGIVELATNAETATGTDTARAVTPANVASVYAAVTRTIRANTGTSDTLVLGDAGNIVTSSNGSAQTITIPPNSSVAYAVGTQIDIVNKGAGVTSVLGGSGVTLNGDASAGIAAINAQYDAVTILKDATDTWFIFGGHGGVA